MSTPPPHGALPVPLPLDQYAHAFDDLFHTHMQRRRLREYLAGLLLPRERNKTLTALVGAEPIIQASSRRRLRRCSNCNSSSPKPIGMPWR
jgi:hypothetical protein